MAARVWRQGCGGRKARIAGLRPSDCRQTHAKRYRRPHHGSSGCSLALSRCFDKRLWGSLGRFRLRRSSHRPRARLRRSKPRKCHSPVVFIVAQAIGMSCATTKPLTCALFWLRRSGHRTHARLRRPCPGSAGRGYRQPEAPVAGLCPPKKTGRRALSEGCGGRFDKARGWAGTAAYSYSYAITRPPMLSRLAAKLLAGLGTGNSYVSASSAVMRYTS